MPKRYLVYKLIIATILLSSVQLRAQDLAKSTASPAMPRGTVAGVGSRASAVTAPSMFLLVKGTVKDASGNLAGVTVTERGTSNATSTDNNGRFSINVSSNNSVLIFSSVGYKSQEVQANRRSMWLWKAIPPNYPESLLLHLVSAAQRSHSVILSRKSPVRK